MACCKRYPATNNVGIIQKGDVTHHHDQVMTEHSFKMMNVNPNRLRIERDDELFEFFDMIILVFEGD